MPNSGYKDFNEGRLGGESTTGDVGVNVTVRRPYYKSNRKENMKAQWWFKNVDSDQEGLIETGVGEVYRYLLGAHQPKVRLCAPGKVASEHQDYISMELCMKFSSFAFALLCNAGQGSDFILSTKQRDLIFNYILKRSSLCLDRLNFCPSPYVPHGRQRGRKIVLKNKRDGSFVEVNSSVSFKNDFVKIKDHYFLLFEIAELVHIGLSVFLKMSHTIYSDIDGFMMLLISSALFEENDLHDVNYGITLCLDALYRFMKIDHGQSLNTLRIQEARSRVYFTTFWKKERFLHKAYRKIFLQTFPVYCYEICKQIKDEGLVINKGGKWRLNWTRTDSRITNKSTTLTGGNRSYTFDKRVLDEYIINFMVSGGITRERWLSMQGYSPSVFPTIDNRINFFVTGGQDALNNRLDGSCRKLPENFINPRVVLEFLNKKLVNKGNRDSLANYLHSFLSHSNKSLQSIKLKFNTAAMKAVGIIAFTHDDIYKHILCRNFPQEHFPKFKANNRALSTSQTVLPDNLGATVFLKFFSLIEDFRSVLSKSDFKNALLTFLHSEKLDREKFKKLIKDTYVEFYYRVPESRIAAFRTYYFRERTKELRDIARRKLQLNQARPRSEMVPVPFGEDPLSLLANPRSRSSSAPVPVALGDDPLSILATQEPKLPQGYKANKRYDAFTSDLFSLAAWVSIFGRSR